MDIYDHSPSIPMKEGWRVSVSGHADAACRIKITDENGGTASLLYDPLGALCDDGIPTWEIFPICWDAATVRLDADILPWIERALIDSLKGDPYDDQF
jgi:hypothetical protein